MASSDAAVPGWSDACLSASKPVSSRTSRTAHAAPGSPSLSLPFGKVHEVPFQLRTSTSLSCAGLSRMQPHTGIWPLYERNSSNHSARFARSGASKVEAAKSFCAKTFMFMCGTLLSGASA